ncbi:MAG: serine protease, partial [Planctomycetia bacterium]|nr:serine protease [Planctomycetia bacterium]
MLRNLTFGKLKNESGTKAPLIHLAAAFTVWWASTAPGFAVDLADLPTGGAAPQPVVAVACPGGNCPLRPYSVRPAPPVAPNIAPIEVSPPQMSLSPNQRAAVVRIVSNISPRSRGLGSGVLVATEQQLGIIVTARHVVGERDNRLAMDATPEATVWFGDGRSVAAQAVYTDRDGFDLAAVIVELPSNLATAELAPAEVGGLPTPGQWVLACGYGGDGQYREQPNRVIGTGSFERPGDCLELLGTFRGGDSGGPVFDTQSRVVAIINASSQPGAAGQDNLATHCGAI